MTCVVTGGRRGVSGCKIMLTCRLLTQDELRQALRFVLDRAAWGRHELESQIRSFEVYAATAGLRIDRQWGAFDGNRLVAACLTVISPGRTAMIFLPDKAGRGPTAGIITELLGHIVKDAPSCDVRLLQAMVPPEDSRKQRILSAAGFRYLAELIYMQRDAGMLFANAAAVPNLKWVTYGAERRAMFESVVNATYQGSLDCPGLNGLRTIEDILSSHRAAGEFNDRWWLVAMLQDEPVGVLLMARVPARRAMEVVYMGVVPRHRGRGLGGAILYKAVKIARDEVCDVLTLAVDAANPPALSMYRRCGFTETARRRAWIATPDASPRRTAVSAGVEDADALRT